MKVPRAVITIVVSGTAASLAVMAPAARADNGKSALGCSNPYQVVHWDSTGQLYFANGAPDPVTAAGLAQGTYTSLQLLPLFAFLDHNGNNQICEKQPNGFTQGTDKRVNYDNLTDDKVLS